MCLGALGGSIDGEGTLSVLSHADPNTCNTFVNPRAVVPVEHSVRISDGAEIVLPPASVAALTVRPAK